MSGTALGLRFLAGLPSPVATFLPFGVQSIGPWAAAGTGGVSRTVPLGDEIVQGSQDQPFVALTFDAGAGATNTPAIMDALRLRGLRTTWFVTGQWVDRYPELFRQLLADGHEIANHTYWHPDLVSLPRDQVLAEIEGAEDAVLRNGGESTRPLFRFPFGSRNGALFSLIGELGYRSIFWTLDSGDWRPELAPATILARVVGDVQPGSIVVMHADSPQTALVLGDEIDRLTSGGYRVTTVTETVLGPEV